MRQYIYLLIALLLVSCNGSKDDPELDMGHITFHFTHYADDDLLIFDELIYTNAAGNQYMVNEIQYFISDVKLHRRDGTYQLIEEWKDIHYVDTDLLETQSWKVFDKIKPGGYDKISFVFGISESKNKSLMFVNPPERDMFWPEVLGGGYHYMKLNGKWLTPEQQVFPCNFHLGIGQIYAGNVIHVDSITGFVQNYFEVQLANSSFEIGAGDTLQFEIRMDVQNWFQHPHIYDHNQWGGDIMQKQEAMQIGCENGKVDVFSILRK